MNTALWTSFRSSKWFLPSLMAGAIIVLLLIGGLALPSVIDINNYRNQIIAQMEQTLGRKVALGQMALSVIPGVRVSVDELRIGEDPQIAQEDFVKAKSVKLQLGLWSLLRGAPQLKGVELLEPEIRLIKLPGDRWNWESLRPLQSSTAGGEQAPFDLSVRNGRFTISDRNVNPAVEKSYTGVNLTLDDFSTRESFNFAVELTAPGEKAGTIKMAGAAGPIDPNDRAQTPIDARVEMKSVELGALESLMGSPAKHGGRLTTDVRLQGKLSQGLKAEGKVSADQLRLVQNVEPARQPLDLDFTLTAKSAKAAAGTDEISVALDRLEAKIGKTRADVAGRIDRLLTSPAVDLTVKAEKAALDDLLESAYAFGFGPPPGTKASGAATVDLRAQGETRAMALNGKAEFQNLKFQTSGMQQPVAVSALKLAFTPDQIVAEPFRATLSQTTVDLKNLRIADYKNQARAHAEIATANAQLTDLVKIAESFGARPSVLVGAGTATLEATVESNLNAAATGMTINGRGNLNGARLQMSQAAKPIEGVRGDFSFTGDSLRADNLGAQLGASQINGWAQVKDFDRPFVAFNLSANQLNLNELQQAFSGPKSAGDGGLSADGQLAVGKLILDSVTVADFQSKVKIARQVITLDPASLNLYGGTYKGAIVVDQSGGGSPSFALRGAFNGVDVNQLLSASGQGSSISGQANGSLNVRGRNDASQEATLKSLTGSGAVAVNNGRFTSFDLMKQVGVLGKLLNLPSSSGGGGTSFRTLKANLTFDQGRMRTDALQLIMDEMQVSGNGSIGLGTPNPVDYDLLGKLSPALSQRLTSASGVGGLGASLGQVASAFSGFFYDQNSMVIPLSVSGPIKQPSFGLNSSVLEKQAKKQVTQGLIEGFIKKPGQTPGKAQSSPDPTDLIKGVLEGLGGRKKPKN